MSNDDHKIRLNGFRLAAVEDIVSALLAFGGVDQELISRWRGYTDHSETMTYRGYVNEICAKLRPQQPPPRNAPVLVFPGRQPRERSTLSMCGRARLETEWREIKIQLDLSADSVPLNLKPSWNIPPTGSHVIVANRAGAGRVARLGAWGLIPSWSEEPKMRGATFNAKSETMRELPTFRTAWGKGRRCLIPIDGYYEWFKGTKDPVTVARRDGKLLTLGGLWERWQKGDQPEVYSCTVITVPAGPKLGGIHDREPLIIDRENWATWLGEEPGDVDALVRSHQSDDLVSWRVSKEVENVKNDFPRLAEPMERYRAVGTGTRRLAL